MVFVYFSDFCYFLNETVISVPAPSVDDSVSFSTCLLFIDYAFIVGNAGKRKKYVSVTKT